MSESQKTIGELRIRTSFNPDNNSNVEQIKQSFAILINKIVNISVLTELDKESLNQDIDQLHSTVLELAKTSSEPEFRRLIDCTITELNESRFLSDQNITAYRIESAAMWAVKAATYESYMKSILPVPPSPTNPTNIEQRLSSLEDKMAWIDNHFGWK